MTIARALLHPTLRRAMAAAAALALGVPVAFAAYIQTNLVSDLPGVAAHQDANLRNPWGISSSPTSPFWVADNVPGVSTLYNSSGTPFPVASPLVVSIPPFGGVPANPTGTVFNANGSGASGSFAGDRFLFATEQGTIAGWQGGTTAAIRAAVPDARYTGLAIGTAGGADRLFAANFAMGTVDVFDSAYSPTSAPGGFTDPNLPAGYAPFNVQNLGGLLYVTYAQSDQGDEVPGPGKGFVDTFDTSGVLQQRLISSGPLDAPWGLAIAPAGFGQFANTLLVGNFGDGMIHAFDPVAGNLLGTLARAGGAPIVIDGLWGLIVGNGGNGGDANTVYFAAGIDGETHGLFGALSPVPEPATLALVALAVLAQRATRSSWSRSHRARSAAAA